MGPVMVASWRPTYRLQCSYHTSLTITDYRDGIISFTITTTNSTSVTDNTTTGSHYNITTSPV